MDFIVKEQSIGIASKMAVSFILWYPCLSTYNVKSPPISIKNDLILFTNCIFPFPNFSTHLSLVYTLSF